MIQLLACKIWDKLQIRSNWNQIFPIAVIGVTFSFFVISTVNYKHETWFLWLISSRVLMGIIAVLLVAWLSTHTTRYQWLDTAYITLGLAVQASHGILEGSTHIDFYQYTGFFILQRH